VNSILAVVNGAARHVFREPGGPPTFCGGYVPVGYSILCIGSLKIASRPSVGRDRRPPSQWPEDDHRAAWSRSPPPVLFGRLPARSRPERYHRPNPYPYVIATAPESPGRALHFTPFISATLASFPFRHASSASRRAFARLHLGYPIIAISLTDYPPQD